ncbi:antiviral reverse transcriptase Drt3a [Uliginosibacterium sp. 31-16]|uniref:antiviral reverse transcriptase Drt3a n=1 Tax=Uliginosibacterium sp. 31-16 TaxID=3068315 RepID=UPI00273F9CB6|nr:antiviral reverse transcriptase Drt3a [Uliginosibacterium sp. 31-16]MDP5239118.1 antiviral reverse transcriptase Drt3a [Uliginosibacterium sp. 31-16]
MYDQSICRKTLERVLFKRDFRKLPAATHSAFREEVLAGAVTSALSKFNAPHQPLVSFPLKGKPVYRFLRKQDELLARKVVQNLKYCVPRNGEGRSQIVANLRLLLAEGVPYRVYRLDIRSFYESFQKSEVLKVLSDLRRLSPQSKSLIEAVLDAHGSIGGSGVPRGLALSAVLSDLLMRGFDHFVRSASDVFYYSRYVDDIIIVTSAREKQDCFVRELRGALPSGLDLNPDKKAIVEILTKVAKDGGSHPVKLIEFDYLGYAFSVSNPTKTEAGKKKDGDLSRSVWVDISSRKIKKIKTRLVRSFFDFSKNNDWHLLRDRIAFLTQNFSVYNPKAGGKKVAGIYHSYPLVTVSAGGLLELDRFLRNAVLANSGRVFSNSAMLLEGKQKRQLLKYSFARGHASKSFVHFSGQRISDIQRCWKN